MKPLSTVTYLKSNVKKVLPGLGCMSLGVFLVYFSSILLYSGIYGMNLSYLNIFERVTSINANSKDPIADKILNKIKGCGNVDYIVPIINNIGYFEYKTPFGEITTDGFNVFSEDVPKILKIFDTELIKGKLPSSNSNEILIPVKIAKQNRIEIGDYIGKNPDLNMILNKKYKVCGIIDGPVNIMLTTNAGTIRRDEAIKHRLIFSLRDNNDKTINDEIKAVKEKNVTVIDYKFAYEQMNGVIRAMNSFRFILNLIIIIVLCISLGNLNYILFLNRRDEFSILTAIGYKKKTVYIKLLKENFTLNLLSFIFGIGITVIIVGLLNITLFQPKGQYVYSFELKSIFTAFLIPLSVSITNMISPLRKLKNMDYNCLNI